MGVHVRSFSTSGDQSSSLPRLRCHTFQARPRGSTCVGGRGGRGVAYREGLIAGRYTGVVCRECGAKASESIPSASQACRREASGRRAVSLPPDSPVLQQRWRHRRGMRAECGSGTWCGNDPKITTPRLVAGAAPARRMWRLTRSGRRWRREVRRITRLCAPSASRMCPPLGYCPHWAA